MIVKNQLFLILDLYFLFYFSLVNGRHNVSNGTTPTSSRFLLKVSGSNLHPVNKPISVNPIAHALKKRKQYELKHGITSSINKGKTEVKEISLKKKLNVLKRPHSGGNNHLTSERKSYRTRLRGKVNSFAEQCSSLDYCPYWERCYELGGCPDRFIACRDCVGPGEACQNETVCFDPLQYCSGWYGDNIYGEEARNSLPIGHPCRNVACLSYTKSPACLDAVYEFCCDPNDPTCTQSIDVSAAAAEYPCSARGCSTFISEGDNGYDEEERDYSNVDCPFSSDTVCGGKCENLIFQVFEGYVFNECYNNDCLVDLVNTYVPAIPLESYMPYGPVFVNTTNSSKPGDYFLPPGTYCPENPMYYSGYYSDEYIPCIFESALYIDKLFNEERVDGITFNECMFQINDAEEDGICLALLQCMYVINTFFDGHENSQENAKCLGELTMCSTYTDEVAMFISEDMFYFYKQIFYSYLECSGEEADTGQEFDENWNYHSTCNQTSIGCEANCCNLVEDLMTGTPNFGNISSPFFACAQIRDRNSIRLCLQQKCQFCFPMNSGPFGPDKVTAKAIEKSECVQQIYSYCVTNSTDPMCREVCPFTRCDERKGVCPCDEDSCQIIYNLRFIDRTKCNSIRSFLVSDYVRQGFLQPEDEWIIESLKRRNAYILPDEDNVVFFPSSYTMEKSVERGCEYFTSLENCFISAADLCNQGSNYYSEQCKSLSVCGDGVISWGEECDDGNRNEFDDGCRNCEYVSEGYVCPSPGEPCQMCDFDSNSFYDEKSCPFCRNKRLPTNESPCSYEACQTINDFYSAKACDNAVFVYCNEMEENGFYDPGCAFYVEKSSKYGVPRPVNEACQYEIKNIETHFKRVKGLKVALIECKLLDRYGIYANTTPLVPYYSLKHMLSEDEYEDLSTSVQIQLDALTKHEHESLIPLTWLTDHELDFTSDTNLAGQYGPLTHDNHYNRVGTISFEKSLDWQEYGCEYPPGEELFLLAPCDDMVQQMARRYMKRLKFQAQVWGNDESSDLIGLDEAILESFDCIAKPDVIQFGLVLSTNRFEWLDNREQVVEQHIRHCTGMETTYESCPSMESLLRSGHAFINLGSMLFAPHCKDIDCMERVGCKTFDLQEKNPEVDLSIYDIMTERVQSNIKKVGNADSWDAVNLLLTRVSVDAVSSAIFNPVQLFNSFIETGTTPKYLKDVENFCSANYWHFNASSYQWDVNPEWENDPCCNWELREYLCCAPKDIPNGFVYLVVGFKNEKIDSVCSSPSKIKAIAQDMKQKLDVANELREKISAWTDPTEFENIWEFEDECRQKIESSDNDNECVTDADCFCSYSFCTESWDGTKMCSTNQRDMYKCYAQCFYDKYSTENPTLIANLKAHWGLDPLISDIVDFENQWGKYMTESGCAGPESWRPDIGYARYEWICDSNCEASKTCDFYHGIKAVAIELGYSEEIANELSWNTGSCSIYGFSEVCLREENGICQYSACYHPLIENYTMPCFERDECYSKCDIACYDREYCQNNNGTWMENRHACCPEYGFVHTEYYFWSEYPYESCKYYPVGTPERHEFGDETCCLAKGGTWAPTEHGGECCFGILTNNCDGDNCEIRCEDEVNLWSACEKCYNECHDLNMDCRTCYEEREECCASTYIPQNKEACLSYTDCNDKSIYQENQCNDAGREFTGWCGDDGWPRTEESRCQIYTHHDCVSIGGFQQYGNCFKDIGMFGTISQCFPEGCPIYTWEMLYPSFDPPANGFFGSVNCEPGCYLTVLFEVVEYYSRVYCRAEFQDGSGHFRYYHGRYHAALDICQLYWSEQTVCENDLNGTYVSSYYRYDYPRYQTQEQCESGYCEGSINQGQRDPETNRWFGQQPWSRTQCLSASTSMCSRWCPYCSTFNHLFYESQGGCFNTTDFTIIQDESETTCNSPGSVWYSCPNPTPRRLDWHILQDFCQNEALHVNMTSDSPTLIALKHSDDKAIPQQIFSQLACSPNFERCSTEEECNAMGDCRGTKYGWIEFYTETCTEPGWNFGDSHWGFEIVTSTDDNDISYSYTNYVQCSWEHAKRIDGICIKPRENGRCDDYKWHNLGCKTDGYHDERTCTLSGYTWYDVPYTEENCHAVKGCLMDYHMRQYPLEECTRCNGKEESYMKWSGGRMQGSRVREYQWHTNRTFGPINEWIKTQASWKIEGELSIPILRTYTALKMMELQVQYNLYQNVLRAFACDCTGSTNVSNDCFSSIYTGSSTGNLESFAGCDAQQEFGPGSVVQVSRNCDNINDGPGMTRRLQILNATEDSLSNNTGHSTTPPVSIDFTYISAAGNSVLEPCQGNDSTLIDTLVVQYPGSNVFVGQLIGDGIGISSTDDFGSISMCLNARDDVKLFDTEYTYYGVAKREESRYILLDINESLFFSKSATKVCITLENTGEYFPVLSLNPHWLETQNISSFDLKCNACMGSCALSSNLTVSCKCPCGFSGENCDIGCPNYCSGNGDCSPETNLCTCFGTNQTTFYTENDCSRLNCPHDLVSNVICSGHGSCELVENNVVCVCQDGYGGTACENIIMSIANSTENEGYTDTEKNFEEPDYSNFIPPQPNISTTETNNPSPAPTITPTLLPSISPSNAPSMSPSKSPSTSPSESPTYQGETSAPVAPTSNPTITPTTNPTEHPTMPTPSPTRSYVEPEPIVTMSIPVVYNLSSTTFLLQQFKQKFEQSFGLDDEDTNSSAANSDAGRLKVEVKIEKKEKTSLKLASEPNVITKSILLEATRSIRCGKYTPRTECDVKEDILLGRMLGEYELKIVVEETITDESSTSEESANTTAVATVSITDSNFISSLASAVETLSAEQNITVNTTGVTVDEPRIETEAVVAVVYEPSTSGTAVSPTEQINNIQLSAKNTSAINAALTDIGSITVGAVVVDLCEGRTCSGHGTCSDGVCTCDIGYTGSSCEFATDAPTASPTSNPTRNPTPSPIETPTSFPTRSPTPYPVTSPPQPTTSLAVRPTISFILVIPLIATYYYLTKNRY